MFQKLFSKNKFDVLFVSLIILSSIPLILPYFHFGYFPSHDGEWAVVRLAEMFREIKDFQIPPRYSTVLNNGYGYPLFNFAYPFPYYHALIFKMAGFGFIESIKIVFAITVPLSGIGMYFLSMNFWKNRAGGIISAVLYMYLPYRMVDLYVRGSIGESLALAIIPFLFYLALRLKNTRKPLIFVSLSSVLLGSLILTHNIMAVYFVPLYILLCLLLVWLYGKKVLILYIVTIVLGIGMSAFFWFPALFEKNNILLSIIPIADRSLYFVSFQQLFFPSWGYGIPTDVAHAFTYQLGTGTIASILATVGYFIFLFIKKIKWETTTKIAFAFLIVLISMFFMLFEPLQIVWESFPILSEINYPWTLLAPLGFIGSMLAGFVVSKNKFMKYIFIGIVITNGFIVFQYAKPEKYVNYEDGYYSTNVATTTSSQEYTPLWVKKLPKKNPAKSVEIINGNGMIQNIQIKSNRIMFDAKIQDESLIRINTIFYPGWKIFVNNNMTNFSYDNQYGVMDFALQPGEYQITAKFVETKPRLISDIISLGSGFVVGGLFAFALFHSIKFHYGKAKK